MSNRYGIAPDDMPDPSEYMDVLGEPDPNCTHPDWAVEVHGYTESDTNGFVWTSTECTKCNGELGEDHQTHAEIAMDGFLADSAQRGVVSTQAEIDEAASFFAAVYARDGIFGG